EHVDRVKVEQLVDLGVRLEAAEVGVGHPLFHLGQALRGQLAVLSQLRVGAVLGEQLAPRDLDPEVTLEAEDDVEQVDRLGPQVLERGRVRRQVVFVPAEGINQGGLAFLVVSYSSLPDGNLNPSASDQT